MAPLPAFKLILLAIRQLSKPIVKATVTRAQGEATLTRTLCIGLGRFSLGVQCVVATWSADEKSHRNSNNNSGGGSSSSTIINNDGNSMNNHISGVESSEQHHYHHSNNKTTTNNNGKNGDATESLLVAPRSRSLLQNDQHNSDKQKKELNNTVSGGRLFLFRRRPVHSAWQAFRSAFEASVDEEKVVNAGAEFLIELIVYSILVVLLYFEISTSAKSTEAREQHLLQRIDALERKVNELIHDHHGDAVDALLEVPEPAIVSRLGRVKGGLKSVWDWSLEKIKI